MTRLVLRPAHACDAQLLFEWANDSSVRSVAYRPEPIPWEDHQRWFAARLADPATHLYIAEVASEPVGQIRFEDEGKSSVLSVSLAAGARGLGLGTLLIRQGTDRLFADTDVCKVYAYVRNDNPASMRAFEKAGFVLEKSVVEQGVPSKRLVDHRTVSDRSTDL